MNARPLVKIGGAVLSLSLSGGMITSRRLIDAVPILLSAKEK